MDLPHRLDWKRTTEMTWPSPSGTAQTLTSLHRLVSPFTTLLPSPARLSTWIYLFLKLQDLLLNFLLRFCLSQTVLHVLSLYAFIILLDHYKSPIRGRYRYHPHSILTVPCSYLLGEHLSPPGMPTWNACASLAEGNCPALRACLACTQNKLEMLETNAPGRSPEATEIWWETIPAFLPLIQDNSEMCVVHLLPGAPAALSSRRPRG